VRQRLQRRARWRTDGALREARRRRALPHYFIKDFDPPPCLRRRRFHLISASYRLVWICHVAMIACRSKRRTRTVAASDAAATSTNASSMVSLPRDLIGLFLDQKAVAQSLRQDSKRSVQLFSTTSVQTPPGKH
jgi:hypothetical protein